MTGIVEATMAECVAAMEECEAALKQATVGAQLKAAKTVDAAIKAVEATKAESRTAFEAAWTVVAKYKEEEDAALAKCEVASAEYEAAIKAAIDAAMNAEAEYREPRKKALTASAMFKTFLSASTVTTEHRDAMTAQKQLKMKLEETAAELKRASAMLKIGAADAAAEAAFQATRSQHGTALAQWRLWRLGGSTELKTFKAAMIKSRAANAAADKALSDYVAAQEELKNAVLVANRATLASALEATEAEIEAGVAASAQMQLKAAKYRASGAAYEAGVAAAMQAVVELKVAGARLNIANMEYRAALTSASTVLNATMEAAENKYKAASADAYTSSMLKAWSTWAKGAEIIAGATYKAAVLEAEAEYDAATDAAVVEYIKAIEAVSAEYEVAINAALTAAEGGA